MASASFRKRLPILSLIVACAAISAQEKPPQELPRFRSGANLVRLDAYVSADGKAIADLTANDFEVLEDGRPQRIESFQLIRARASAPEAVRVEPASPDEARSMAAAADARLFVLFLDFWHVHIEGSYNAQNPIVNFLNQVIGQDDMVGVMTPEMSARNLTLARRTTTIEGMLRDNWAWGQRQRLTTPDPRERELQDCYPDVASGVSNSPTTGIAQELIDRRRERKTLDAIEDLIVHLEGIREERKFVVLLSEGWQLPRPNSALTRYTDDSKRVPKVDPIGIDSGGKLTTGAQAGELPADNCDRERVFLSQMDFQQDFQTLMQRANRANVSFYTVDPRGLVAFDEDLSARRASNIAGDRQRLAQRQGSLRDLAAATDGLALLDTNNLSGALTRMMADLGTYYLLGYYSTNTKLDGRFRRLTVRVKRPGAQVRSRPGYLAPTEAEAASARVDRLMNGAAPGHSDTPPELRRALDSIVPATRGVAPIRVAAVGGLGRITITTEIDATVLKTPEWQQGGTARVSIEHSRGDAAPVQREVTLTPGQNGFSLEETGGGTLPAGRYVLRVSLTPKGSSLPLQTTIDVTVPEAGGLLGSTGLASRRGPTTGLQYVATADTRYRRTERIRFEVPRFSNEGTVSARLLSRDGQALPLTVATSERVDEASKARFVVADLTLAPLAQGEYVLEVAVAKEDKTERAVYAFRIVP